MSTVETLRAIVIAIWASVSPAATRAHDGPAIADAIAAAVAADDAPAFDDLELEAATMARWAWEESRLSEHPRPFSWDAHAGIAHGVWQLHGPAGLADVGTQARAWLALAHDGARWCPQSPLAPLSGACGGLARRVADRRVREVRRVLEALAERALEEHARMGAPIP